MLNGVKVLQTKLVKKKDEGKKVTRISSRIFTKGETNTYVTEEKDTFAKIVLDYKWGHVNGNENIQGQVYVPSAEKEVHRDFKNLKSH